MTVSAARRGPSRHQAREHSGHPDRPGASMRPGGVTVCNSTTLIHPGWSTLPSGPRTFWAPPTDQARVLGTKETTRGGQGCIISLLSMTMVHHLLTLHDNGAQMKR